MKFRRNKSDSDQPEVESADVAASAGESEVEAPSGLRAQGPWDISEVQLQEDDPSKLDLGSLIVTPREGLEIQLQVDEASGNVVAVLLAGETGAVELRAFAAPRNGEIWTDVRKQIAAEVTRRGGTATEADGPWGPELRVAMVVTTPDGQTGTQPSRVYGIGGPRWMLRATVFGKPAMEPESSDAVELALRDVIVRRGDQPHAPGESLPLTPPTDLNMTQV